MKAPGGSKPGQGTKGQAPANPAPALKTRIRFLLACRMTGCCNARISIPGVLFVPDQSGLNPDAITLAEIVKPKGWATALLHPHWSGADRSGQHKPAAAKP